MARPTSDANAFKNIERFMNRKTKETKETPLELLPLSEQIKIADKQLAEIDEKKNEEKRIRREIEKRGDRQPKNIGNFFAEKPKTKKQFKKFNDNQDND